MKKFFAVTGVVALALSLAGCSGGPRSYADASALKDAYIQAGGACPNPNTIDLSAFNSGGSDMAGTTGVACEGNIGMFVFKTVAGRDSFVKLIENIASTSKMGQHLVVGDLWVVGGVNLDNAKYAPLLGGEAKN